MNFDQARFNMVEQQIRTWEVLDQTVLDLVGSTHRERYVPAEYQRLAYADTEVPLPDGQTMLAPKLVARQLQALQVKRNEFVLEIGTGSAYLTALLAELARHVLSVEISPILHARAASLLESEGVENVTLKQGDAAKGWPEEAPYDVIAINGSLTDIDDLPSEQLKVGGRLFAVVGRAPAMEALLVTRATQTEWIHESLFETVISPLQGAERAQEFVL